MDAIPLPKPILVDFAYVISVVEPHEPQQIAPLGHIGDIAAQPLAILGHEIASPASYLAIDQSRIPIYLGNCLVAIHRLKIIIRITYHSTASNGLSAAPVKR